MITEIIFYIDDDEIKHMFILKRETLGSDCL